MRFEHDFPAYGWFPGSTRLSGEEWGERAQEQWLRENFGEKAQWWSSQIIRCVDTDRAFDKQANFLLLIARHDAAEFVDLLFPRYPSLFLESRSYLSLLGGWASNHLEFSALCALLGAERCLAALLDYGCDPNGMESHQAWNTLSFHRSGYDSYQMPVTPLDCALLAKEEGCQLILETHGAQLMHELCGLPVPMVPEWVPIPLTVYLPEEK